MNAQIGGLLKVRQVKHTRVPTIITSHINAFELDDQTKGVGMIYGSTTRHSFLLCSYFVLTKTAGMQPRVESLF
ncbi:hypothetical protein ASD52_01875 [Ensifer sp. Root142]|nr:hypothetical protein ASD52_01875 [Ensifer sp. Root142]